VKGRLLDGHGNLHEQPGDDRVDGSDLKDLAALDFLQKRHVFTAAVSE
jgi:hypothetical protein